MTSDWDKLHDSKASLKPTFSKTLKESVVKQN